MIANPAPHILATQPGLFKRTTHKVLIYEGSSIFLGWSLTKDYIVNPVEMPACRGEVSSFSTHHFQLYSVNRTHWGGEGLGTSKLALSKMETYRWQKSHLIASSLNAKKIEVIKDLFVGENSVLFCPLILPTFILKCPVILVWKDSHLGLLDKPS